MPDHEYGLPHVVTYRRCDDCGSLSQDPMPNLRELSAYYPANYHSFGPRSPLASLKHRARLERIRSLLGGGPRTLLDYGCGNGDFLRAAAARHPEWRCWGFEIAERPETIVEADGRITIVRGRPAEVTRGWPRFDLVTMNHVIEHLPDPADVLTALSRHMRPGALVEGQTPAADSLERDLFGTAWSGFHAPRHTVVFSRRGLSTLLTRTGFVDVAVAPGFNPAGIAVSLAAALHGPRGGSIERRGAAWSACLAAATLLQPIDRLSGRPGIVDFVARTRSAGGDA